MKILAWLVIAVTLAFLWAIGVVLAADFIRMSPEEQTERRLNTQKSYTAQGYCKDSGVHGTRVVPYGGMTLVLCNDKTVEWE